MHVAFSDEQLELRDGIRAALKTECPPEVVRASWTGPVPSLHEALAELGVPALSIAEEHDGLGQGPLDWVLVAEELGRACVPGTAAETLVLGPILSAHAPALATAVAAGEASVSLHATGEPCPWAADVDQIFTVGDEGLSRRPGRTLRPLLSIDLSRRLADVEGPHYRVEADGVQAAALVAVSAQLIGLSRHMLDGTVAYAKVREQFGNPIGSFQAVQHQLADALVALRFAAPVVYQAAWSCHHAASHRELHAHMAKAKASQAAACVSRVALQVHGAIGYTTEYDLHLWLKRALALQRAWGDTNHHLDAIATCLAGTGDAPTDGLDFGDPHA